MSRDTRVLLDGGTATELQRHGIELDLPWLTSAPLLTPDGRAVLERVHADYIAAGARVISANTFRVNLRAVRRAGGVESTARMLLGRAVSVARAARDRSGTDARVAVSMAPVEDCYQPSLVPDDADLAREHRWFADTAAELGAELVLVETMNSIREAVIATRSAVSAGLVPWVSFVCSDGAWLLSGEDLRTAVRAVEDAGARAVLVNCTEIGSIEACLVALRATANGMIGVYPNVEDRTALPDWTHVAHHVPVRQGAAELVGLMRQWIADHDLDIIGACCGSTPEHIAALHSLVGPGGGGPMPAASTTQGYDGSAE
jgi:homocysteine S-methyltransferase